MIHHQHHHHHHYHHHHDHHHHHHYHHQHHITITITVIITTISVPHGCHFYHGSWPSSCTTTWGAAALVIPTSRASSATTRRGSVPQYCTLSWVFQHEWDQGFGVQHSAVVQGPSQQKTCIVRIVISCRDKVPRPSIGLLRRFVRRAARRWTSLEARFWGATGVGTWNCACHFGISGRFAQRIMTVHGVQTRNCCSCCRPRCLGRAAASLESWTRAYAGSLIPKSIVDALSHEASWPTSTRSFCVCIITYAYMYGCM